MIRKENTYSYRINIEDIDFRKQVSILSLTNYILSSAGKNADENGIGLLSLQEHGYTWVLSRFVIDMIQFPQQKERVFIKTWIEKMSGVFILRNFIITAEDGNIIGYAATSWAIIDLTNRQSVLPEKAIPSIKEFLMAQSTPIGMPERIPNKKGSIKNNFQVQCSHLDVNEHANTRYYIQWIQDCFPIDFYRKHQIKRIEINFLKELIYEEKGDVLHYQEDENSHFCQIVNHKNEIACRAKLRSTKTQTNNN